MASICTRCALRIHRKSHLEITTTTTTTTNLTISTSSSHLTARAAYYRPVAPPREVPSFKYGSNEALNDTLTTFRDKYLVPAFLTKREQKLIFSPNQASYLQENPQTVTVGGEKFELKSINRLTDRPARNQLVKKALGQILQSKHGGDWENIGELLSATQLFNRKRELVNENLQAKIVRKAFQQGKIAFVMTMLHQSHKTGMTLKNNPVLLQALVRGFREMGQQNGWEEAGVEKALKHMDHLARFLETDQHGTGAVLRKGDPRRSPVVIGVMLELAAVYAWKHGDRTDEYGVVHRYADRLLSNMGQEDVSLAGKGQGQGEGEGEAAVAPLVLQEIGPQWPFMEAISILHGVFVANRMLGEKMPQADKARQVIANYEAKLSALAEVLESRAPAEGSYDHMALEAWKGMIRD